MSAEPRDLVVRCQGARWRRVTRSLMAILFALLLATSDGPRNHSVGSWVLAIVIDVLIIAALDAWFSRRMGLTVDEQGLVLRYAFRRKRVPWADVEGFEWRRWNSPRSEWIWITHRRARATRIPTIQRTPGGEDRSGLAYRLFASESVRLDGGRESDAMTTLLRARAAVRRDREDSDESDPLAATPSTSPGSRPT